MKPAPIADYLHHLPSAPGERVSSRRESSLRPGGFPSAKGSETRPAFPFGRVSKAAGGAAHQAEGGAPPMRWDGRRLPTEPNANDSVRAREAAKAEELAVRLAEAHARGREEGRAEALAEAEELRAADHAAAQEQALAERVDFQLNEYARLERTLRAGLAEIEDKVGAAAARILAPFLAKEVVKHVTDELAKNIKQLCSGGSPGLITIRGPERVLKLLRARIADLAVEVDYVENDAVEAVVEANATQIVTQLHSWADLLASLGRSR
jgi:hypothetical protein